MEIIKGIIGCILILVEIYLFWGLAAALG